MEQITSIVKERGITNMIEEMKNEMDKILEFEEKYGFEFIEPKRDYNGASSFNVMTDNGSSFTTHQDALISAGGNISVCDCHDSDDDEYECMNCEELFTDDNPASKFCELMCRNCYTCEACNEPFDIAPNYYCYRCIRDDNDFSDDEMSKYFNDIHNQKTFIAPNGKEYYQTACWGDGSAIICKDCTHVISLEDFFCH